MFTMIDANNMVQGTDFLNEKGDIPHLKMCHVTNGLMRLIIFYFFSC